MTEVAGVASQEALARPVIWQRERAVRLASAGLFILRRLAFGVVILLAIAFLSFLGLEMARGTDFRPAVGYAAASTVAYMGQLVQGNLGYTQPGTVALLPVPISEILGPTVAKSLGLLGFSLLIATAVGIILGLIAAGHRHSRWSLGIILLSIVGISIPSFFAALVLQLLMIRWAQAFGSPLLPLGGFGWNDHIILPALVLAARPVAQISRVTFISVADVLGLDFVRTAASKGLWPRQIWSRHVIRNAAIPILTTVGLSLRFSLSSLPVVEFFFGWPGIGYTLLKSISRQDDNLTVALVLSLGILFILVNLVLDLSYRVIDPQLREAASRVRRGAPAPLANRLRELPGRLRDLLVFNPVSDWWRARQRTPEPSPFRRVLQEHGSQVSFKVEDYQSQRRRAWWRGTLGNLPFVLGSAILLALLAVVLFGPRLAPHNPYTTQGLTIVDGQFLVPPFAPGAEYPWGTDVLGRDVMSLILAGAQQTLLLALLVVAARLVVGFVLGALAGWLSGSWVDRGLLSLAEIIAAFPTLLLAMTLILAIGIRQGMRPFVIALCFVGWGEIMQFVRGEVMGIRPKLYIESAVAVGLRSTRIIVGHVLPILLSALISLAALEMGAVLMLLGELGFVSIFIGGGAFAELEIFGPLYHYSDVPEWGSLLSSVRAYARAYPWVAIYPALAFFVAILGFNLFGEGLRRMVETVGIGLSRLFNRYTFTAAVVALVALNWARSNTGSMAFYREQARTADGRQALAAVQTLTDPVFEGRSLGTAGMGEAEAWIAAQFEELGLQAAGQSGTYFQNRTRAFTVISQAPALQLQDSGAVPVYHQDFAEYPGYYNGVGQAQAPVRAIAFGDMDGVQVYRGGEILSKMLEGDEVLLVLSKQDAAYAERAPRAGLLVVADDPQALTRRITPSGRSAVFLNPITGKVTGRATPTLWISEELANRLLAPSGETVAGLRQQAQDLPREGVLDLATGAGVSMVVTGTLEDKWPASNVIGHWPGVSGRAGSGEATFDRTMPGSAVQDARGGDAQLDDELVVVLARYDSPPVGPEGVWPMANDNASGVAVMLETIRAMKESGYEPYRTFLFVAYSGEGLDGGEPIEPKDVSKFIQAKAGFATAFDVEAIVNLQGLGAGQGDGLVLAASGNQRLASLFESAARRSGVSTRRAETPVDLSIVFEDRSMQEGGGQEAPYILLTWDGWEGTARTAADTPDRIRADKLEQAARTLALALMTIGREDRY